MVGTEKEIAFIRDEGSQQLVFVLFPRLPFSWILPAIVKINIEEDNTKQKKGHSYCPMKHADF